VDDPDIDAVTPLLGLIVIVFEELAQAIAVIFIGKVSAELE
jgi:hypothetical protein